MTKKSFVTTALSIMALVSACSSDKPPKPEFDESSIETSVMTRTNEPVNIIHPRTSTDEKLVELGKKLYFEPRLSRSGFISCNSCHNLSIGGSDNLKTSIGHKWQKGPINAPTVLNSSMNIAQFWNGRAKDLKEQAAEQIANPGEMAYPHELAVAGLQTIPGYRKDFRDVFGSDRINIEKISKAIAAFEETQVTPNSRFDNWLKGDDNALTKEELEGYKLFKTSGCTTCHNGESLGGNSYRKMGLVEPYKTPNPAKGVETITGKVTDRFIFKVPTLRNVQLTYPYFHDGEAQTLGQAVEIMGRIQLGRTFSPQENAQIVAFLKTLTGDQPKIVLPILPPSADDTPRHNPFE
jgi:cytochrome c peroxidase